jgi:hypothetical protein
VNFPQEKDVTPETAAIRTTAVESGWRDVPANLEATKTARVCLFA